MIRLISCLGILLCTGPIGREPEKQTCPPDCCEHRRLSQLVINAKIDPAGIPAALEELAKVKDDYVHDHHFIAALYFWEMKEWSRFLIEDDPKSWPDRIEQTSPTMVFVNDVDRPMVFYGAFAYTIGSQFKRTGWFITEITPDGMEIEHQGNTYIEPTWEVKQVTFKRPYLRPILIGPEGFSKMADLPRMDWETLQNNWTAETRNP